MSANPRINNFMGPTLEEDFHEPIEEVTSQNEMSNNFHDKINESPSFFTPHPNRGG